MTDAPQAWAPDVGVLKTAWDEVYCSPDVGVLKAAWDEVYCSPDVGVLKAAWDEVYCSPDVGVLKAASDEVYCSPDVGVLKAAWDEVYCSPDVCGCYAGETTSERLHFQVAENVVKTVATGDDRLRRRGPQSHVSPVVHKLYASLVFSYEIANLARVE